MSVSQTANISIFSASLVGVLSSLQPGIDVSTSSHNNSHLGDETRHAINFQEKEFRLQVNYWEY